MAKKPNPTETANVAADVQVKPENPLTIDALLADLQKDSDTLTDNAANDGADLSDALRAANDASRAAEFESVEWNKANTDIFTIRKQQEAQKANAAKVAKQLEGIQAHMTNVNALKACIDDPTPENVATVLGLISSGRPGATSAATKKDGSTGTAGATSAAIRAGYTEARNAGSNDADARKKLIDVDGFARGTVAHVALIIQKEMGEK